MQVVHKFQDAEVGDIAKLKGGGPDVTITGFVPSDAPTIPTGIQGAYYSDHSLSAKIAWVGENGAVNQLVVPLAALDLKKRDKDDKDKSIL